LQLHSIVHNVRLVVAFLW